MKTTNIERCSIISTFVAVPAIFAVLAMLLHVQGLAYALGVLQATAIIFVAFHAWRRFVLKPIAGIS